MFKKKEKHERAGQFSSQQSPLSYPVGKAAEMLGISKRTLLRRATALGVEFSWDGRGRRIRGDDLQRLLKGDIGDKSDSTFSVSEENASLLELPLSIRVWQRLPSGKGTVLKGDLFCDKFYGCVPEALKQTYGPGEYLVRPIERGILSNRNYKATIAGTPKVQSWKGSTRENNKTFASLSEKPQAEKEKLLSQWLDTACLYSWWTLIKGELKQQKCFLTFEEFISARRNFKRSLYEMEADELKLINIIEAYEFFKAHVQRLCPKREQNDDALSQAQEETRLLKEGLEEIAAEIKRFEQEQAEKNSWFLLLLTCCLIMILLPLLAPTLAPSFKQTGEAESNREQPQNTGSNDSQNPADKPRSSKMYNFSLIPIDLEVDDGVKGIL